MSFTLARSTKNKKINSIQEFVRQEMLAEFKDFFDKHPSPAYHSQACGCSLEEFQENINKKFQEICSLATLLAEKRRKELDPKNVTELEEFHVVWNSDKNCCELVRIGAQELLKKI